MAAFTIALRDPDTLPPVLLVVGGLAVAAGALGALAFVAVGTRGTRGARRDAAALRGLRRGVMVGCAVGLLALLRLVDGLTVLSAAFTLTPFVVAEALLSGRRG